MISRQGKLLVVDDDENNRDMLSRRLARQGYAVDIAESGSQAMDKINAASYDLILLDQMMPGMSGLDLLRLLRATYSPSDLPVIMVTAVDHRETVVKALSDGANDYVTKPVDMPIVSARIEAQLSRSRSERKVREDQQRLDFAARGGSDGIWELNLITGEANVEWTDMLGYAEHEIGTELESWLALVHHQDIARVRADLDATIENRTRELHCEFRLRTKAGGYHWVLARGSVLRTAGGKPLRIAGSFTDLEVLRFSDSLTGLGNRAMLFGRLGEIFSAQGPPFALILFDLDGFKQVNDTYGNVIGDQVLLETAQRFRSVIAASDFQDASIFRIGEDEFCALFADARSAAQVMAFSERLLGRLCHPLMLEKFELATSASAGIVIDEPGRGNLEHVLRDAGLALYQAKQLGKNRAQLFVPGMRERALERIELIRDLRHAIEFKQLRAVYQAKVNLRTLRIVGFEALLRWQHPERGVINPLHFIPLAEESGLIVEIGEWILREAAGQLVQWEKAYPSAEPLSMNVNLSVKQLADPDLLKHIQAILSETGIAPQSLKLELTESALMTDIEAAKGVLRELQGLGIGLKLDDFGTGYSSLSYLRALHFDSLKIDRSFVMKLTEDAETHAIIDTIIKLAHTLEMTVVAEGIEEETQLRELIKLGCDIGQGYYFSRPVDAKAAELLWTSGL